MNQQLLAEIAATLAPAVSPAMTASTRGADLYEAFVFCIALRAARDEGAEVTFEDVHGNPTKTCVLRTSPSQIFTTSHAFTHAVISFPTKPELELHTGIYLAGKSRVQHEADVAVIRRAEGILCRRNRVTPRHSQVLIAMECKFYSSTLGIHLARGFLGLCRDLKGDDVFFVTNTDSDSVDRLLGHHKSNRGHNVVPPQTKNVTFLQQSIVRKFRDFKATN